MSSHDDLNFDSATFSGIARLFPLPNLVLFPHVMQPLHIFEPRYRAMMEAAIASDQMIALASFAPGWEHDYDGRPPLLPIACLGRVATFQRMEGDRFNLMLLGLKRIEIRRELPPIRPFREAEVAIREDIYPPGMPSERHRLQAALIESFKTILPSMGETQDQLDELLGGGVSLGVLTDMLSYTLDMDLPRKAQLLAECNVDRRASLLLEYLSGNERAQILREPTFPPDFSAN
jgi:ATP-dependent Lon protease